MVGWVLVYRAFFFFAPLWAHVLHFKEAFVSWERLLDLTKLCSENSRMASDQKNLLFSMTAWHLHTIFVESVSQLVKSCGGMMLSNYGCPYHCVCLRSNRVGVAGPSPLYERDQCCNLLYSMKWSSLQSRSGKNFYHNVSHLNLFLVVISCSRYWLPLLKSFIHSFIHLSFFFLFLLTVLLIGKKKPTLCWQCKIQWFNCTISRIVRLQSLESVQTWSQCLCHLEDGISKYSHSGKQKRGEACYFYYETLFL